MNAGMPVESPVRGDSHAGFGGRLAETKRPKGRHRAAGRPYLAALRGTRGYMILLVSASGDATAANRRIFESLRRSFRFTR
jgi:hypothetical protein